MQGGSTITQQLIKNRLLGARRTYLAQAATRRGWPRSSSGATPRRRSSRPTSTRSTSASAAASPSAASARPRASTSARRSTSSRRREAALLAGMVRAPNSYSPVVNPERARARRDVVLARMRELGMLSAADDETRAGRAGARAAGRRPSRQPAPYFTDYVRLELEQRFGDVGETSARRSTPRSIWSLQRFAETAVVRGLDRLETQCAAAAARRSRAGACRPPWSRSIRPRARSARSSAGATTRSSQFNRAALARRQPGSAFKPFVYLAALRARGGPPALTAASIVEDAPITLTVGQDTWSPRNYDDRYEGRVTVRRALEQSLNAATVRVAREGRPAGRDRDRARARPRGEPLAECRRSRSARSRRRRSSWPARTCRSPTAACGRGRDRRARGSRSRRSDRTVAADRAGRRHHAGRGLSDDLAARGRDPVRHWRGARAALGVSGASRRQDGHDQRRARRVVRRLRPPPAHRRVGRIRRRRRARAERRRRPRCRSGRTS